MASASAEPIANKASKIDPVDPCLEYERVIIIKDREGLFGEANPSKLPPDYILDSLDVNFTEEEPSTIENTFDSACSRTYEELEEWKKRVQDEERLSRMYKLRHTFSLRFDNRAWLHPDGTTHFDYKAISEEKKESVERFKNRIRLENYGYLGSHPEIQAIISLAVKRLLQVLPQEPIRFLTEFFTTRMGSMKEFEERVEAETRKISKYHISKMRATGKINVRPSTAVRSEISGESWRPELDANHLKKLNIGALAQDFSFDANSVKMKKKKNAENEQLKLTKKSKKKCGQRKYCGCKDWKLDKNRENTGETEEEMLETATFSTLGNLNDNILINVEEYEGEEGMELGDGVFLGEMQDREVEHRNLSTAEAETIASLLVQEFIGGEK